MKTLPDRVVLITGASSGIGRATALRLAGKGAHLALVSRSQGALEDVAKEVGALGRQAIVAPTDVTDSEACRHAVEAAVAHFGRLDVLICSAGLSLRALFEETTLEVMERVMRVNFFGTLYATHFALPHIKKSKGSLVAISSVSGLRGVPTYAMYGASKFAIQGLYEALHVELVGDGVHVGVVAPAFVDTPLRDNVLGPDGKPWPEPPDPPFTIWPVEQCVDCIERLIVQRRREIVFPWRAGAALLLDRLLGCRLGNRIMKRKFMPGKKDGLDG